ncbi:MAG: DUF983 domain-containing protein [Flavobacteriales bacterium]|nr:DUF983 domain-containing protein [Flavobacteriales bacterium]
MASTLVSIAQMKCPRCHEGDVFVHKNAYNLGNAGKMHQHCPACGLDYQPEPGFYFGAGYVSYALTVAVSIAVFVALFPFVDWYRWEIYIGVIAGALLLTFPLLFRYSRVIWLYFFVKYDKQAISKYKSQHFHS